MGSGMYPAGAYVTYEHEYILIFRKGGKRVFKGAEIVKRRESAYFWEERELKGDDGRKEIIKKECYVFDFALDRALKQISDYSCRLNVGESNPEKKVGEFISFLPVLAYDGSHMREVNAAEILDIAMAGTSATLLAKRWKSALLVNVDNDTLSRLLASDEAMEALMRIEGFRSLNEDIKTIINKSEAVKKAKKESENLTPKEKKELPHLTVETVLSNSIRKVHTKTPFFRLFTVGKRG